MKNRNEFRKEMFALDVSTMPDFVDNKGEIIMDLLAGAPTLAGIVPMTGAKANTQVQLNILDTSVVWDAGNCVNTVTGGDTTIDPRFVDVVRLTDREEICLDDLDAKLPMLMPAGARNEILPFAKQYIELKVNRNSKQLEKLAWQGNTGTGTGNMALVDGYLAIADGELSDLAYNDTFADFFTDPIAVVDELLENRTDEMYEMDDFVINMPLSYFSALAKAIRNSFGISGTGDFMNSGQENQAGVATMIYPGTNITVRGLAGMGGKDAIFATSLSNLRYVTDLENDKEDVELYYSKDKKAMVSDLVFAIGFQYEFPGKVLYMTKL